MQQETLSRLDMLREFYGKPITLTSAYRCKEYNDTHGHTQTHSTGRAVDIAVSGADAIKILQIAMSLGFTGYGIKQHGDGRFIHLDDMQDGPRPAIWSYK